MSITFSDADEILRIIDRFPAAEIRFEHGDLKLYIKRTPIELLQKAASVTPISTMSATTPSASAPERPISPSVAVHPPPSAHASSHAASMSVNRAGQIPIESPLIGVFYAAPSPEAPPFVTVGQTVSKGTELCIIEVMKVMNLIKAPVDGRISDIVVANGSTVEVGQALMWISPLENAA